jgi:CheY-like chemotaxis protein
LRAEAAASPALILAIDKDSQVIDAYRRYLSGRNFSVIGLTELDQAIEVARAVQPFAITLDVTMTGEIPASDESPAGGQKHAHIDGWQTLETLKTDPLTRGIPVIVCTLLAEQDKAYRLGATGYLLKPILADDLTTAIQRLGDPHSKR